MVEKLFNSGDVGGEKAIQRQIGLVTEMSRTSDVLFSHLGEGVTWHLFPKFSKPRLISLDGYHISDKLKAMAKQTKDLLVRLTVLPEKYDDKDYRQPSCYLWEIYPPGGHTNNERRASNFHRGIYLPGFGLRVVCPELTEEVAADNLEEYRKSGSIDVDMLSWFEGGEASYGSTNPESAFLNVIRKHPTASLETALWILQSLPHSQINSR